ncbi:MAG TPA: hypothetical protein VGM54_08795 [Chthoniobacter sp.]|jgi:hypothetical protein
MTNRRTFRKIGILILVIGFLGAGVAYWTAERQEAALLAKMRAEGDDTDPSLSSEDSKLYNYNSELNMGKGVMLIQRFFHSIGQLFRGKSLPFTLVTISVLAAFSCFALADRSPPH